MCFKIRLSARALLEAALQMQEGKQGKQAVKMAKGEEKKTPQGRQHWQETKSSSPVKGTVKLRQICTAQVMSCIKNPPHPTHLRVAHLPGQPVLGQGARDLAGTVHPHPMVPANCPEHTAGTLAVRPPAAGAALLTVTKSTLETSWGATDPVSISVAAGEAFVGTVWRRMSKCCSHRRHDR